ncbi:hypothetical protein BDR05DRAFT_584255 [Suillus weaverae]|nr:hypothetical protein BDR05DRAFT_584255 [Suillus weaverae]
MHLSFLLAVVAAFKLTVSMPAIGADSQCPTFCGDTGSEGGCYSGFECKVALIDPKIVSMSSFHNPVTH